MSGGLDSNQKYVHPQELLIDVVSIRRYILITTRVTITPPPEKRYFLFLKICGLLRIPFRHMLVSKTGIEPA